MSRFSYTLIVFSALVRSALGSEAGLFTFDEPIMGTRFRISLYSTNSSEAKQASDLAFARVRALNEIYSDYLRESEVMKLCAAPAGLPVKVSTDLFSLLQIAQQISTASGGAFDVTSGHLSHLWRRTRRQMELPTAKRLADALGKTNWQWVQLGSTQQEVTLLKADLLLDLGGIAKGRAADEALKVLREQGMPRSIVIAGGDMAIGQAPPEKIGWAVQLKISESNTIGITLQNCGVSTSGDLHQYVEIQGKRYGHIVDPKTGLGLTNGIACSVIAPNATSSDALATAICVLGAEKGLKMLESMPQHEARIVVPLIQGGETVQSTPGFPAIELIRN